MSIAAPETILFALWVATAALAAPLLLGLLLGGRFLRAQRRVARAAIVGAPALLVAGLLLPDPLGGRPLVRLGGGAERTELPGAAEPGLGVDDVSSLTLSGEALPEAAPHSIRPEAPAIPDRPRARAVAPPGDASGIPAPDGPRALHGPRTAAEPTGSPSALAGGLAPAEPAPLACDPAGGVLAPDAAEPDLPPVAALGPGAPAPTPPGAGPLLPSRAAIPREELPPPRSRASIAPIASIASIIDAIDARTVVGAVAFIWLTGALLRLLGLGASLAAIARLRQSASAVGSTRGVPLIDPRLAPLAVRIIPGLRGAAAVGVFAPEVWLPADWSARLGRADLHAVIAHETAHHRGRDPLWRLLGALATALLWPHPLVHALARREEGLSELIADRQVLAAGAGPRRYAELLADLAADAGGERLPLAAGVFGTRSPLERRVRMILSTPAGRSARDGGWAAPALLGALCAGAIAATVCFPLVGVACDPVKAPAPAVEVVATQPAVAGDLLGWFVDTPCADAPAPAEPFAGDGRSDELARLRAAIARIEAELAERARELERLHIELAHRAAERERHAQRISERAGAERAAVERELADAHARLAREESELALRPTEARAAERVRLAERRADLARHATELHARRQEELAELHARLAEEQREIGEAAEERLSERLEAIAELAEERDRLVEERRVLAARRGDLAELADSFAESPDARADSSLRRALELELRARAHGFEEHAELAAEAAEELAGEAALALEEGLEELLGELHEEMAELHARLEDLPDLIEGLRAHRDPLRREGGGDAEGYEIEIDRLRGALGSERERSARLEAENRDLRRVIEELERRSRAGGSASGPLRERIPAPSAPPAPRAPAAAPAWDAAPPAPPSPGGPSTPAAPPSPGAPAAPAAPPAPSTTPAPPAPVTAAR